MADSFEITDEMRALIGVESDPWTYELTTTSVRAFARGVGYTDKVYFDVDAAKAAGYDNLPAPPCYLGTPIYLPGESSEVFSGPRGSGPELKHGLPGLLDGGTETVYERPLVAGETLTATTKLVDLETKQSKGLGVMLISTQETTWRDQSGATVATQRAQAIFY
jgi:acyl dehydratase